MNSSPFSRLPAELREQIFDLAFTHPADLIILCSSGKPQLAQPQGSQPLALAQTCRQIRHESLPVFFRKNRFILQTDHITTFHHGYGVRTASLSTLRHWLELIGDNNRRQVREIDIDIESWELHGTRYNGKTAELVWSSVLPALRMIGTRTRMVLRCSLNYIDQCGMSSAELRIPLRDPEPAEKAIREFFAEHGWWTDEDVRMAECLKLVSFTRKWEQAAREMQRCGSETA